MHGYTREELIGAMPTMFIHPDSLHLFGAYLDAVKAGGVFHAQATDLTKEGTPFAVEVRGRLFPYQGRPRILGVVRDISERAQAFELLEARVAARTREIAALLEVSYTLASTLELQPLLLLILDTLVAVVPYQAAAVFILEREDTLRLFEYAGPLSAEVIARRWPLAQARHSGEVIRTGRPLIIPDVYAPSPAARAFRETAIDQLGAVPPDIACWMGVPLVCRERVNRPRHPAVRGTGGGALSHRTGGPQQCLQARAGYLPDRRAPARWERRAAGDRG
jgi:hypothetical protein